MQLIYRASDLTDAHIVAGLLESEGIQTHVSGHYLQGGVGDLAPTDLAKVYVAEADADEALARVTAYQAKQTPPETAISQRPSSALPPALLLVIGFTVVATLVYAIAW